MLKTSLFQDSDNLLFLIVRIILSTLLSMYLFNCTFSSLRCIPMDAVSFLLTIYRFISAFFSTLAFHCLFLTRWNKIKPFTIAISSSCSQKELHVLSELIKWEVKSEYDGKERHGSFRSYLNGSSSCSIRFHCMAKTTETKWTWLAVKNGQASHESVG